MLSPPGVEERQSPKASSSEAALLIALKTSPFPERSSLLERAAWPVSEANSGPWVLLPLSHGSGAAGLELLLPKEEEMGFSARPALSLQGLSLPAPSLQTEMGDREKSFNPPASLRHKQGLIFGKLHGGEGGSAPVDVTRSDAPKPNG